MTLVCGGNKGTGRTPKGGRMIGSKGPRTQVVKTKRKVDKGKGPGTTRTPLAHRPPATRPQPKRNAIGLKETEGPAPVKQEPPSVKVLTSTSTADIPLPPPAVLVLPIVGGNDDYEESSTVIGEEGHLSDIGSEFDISNELEHHPLSESSSDTSSDEEGHSSDVSSDVEEVGDSQHPHSEPEDSHASEPEDDEDHADEDSADRDIPSDSEARPDGQLTPSSVSDTDGEVQEETEEADWSDGDVGI